MKIRQGFVSNSSTTSFCIYGWSEKMLSEYIATFCPIFKNVHLEIDSDEFLENIEKEYDGPEWDIVSVCDEEGEQFLGVGSAGQSEQYDVSGEEPGKSKKDKLDLIVRKFNLPQPKMFTGVFHS